MQGTGKIWLQEGRVFIGKFYADKMEKGTLFEL